MQRTSNPFWKFHALANNYFIGPPPSQQLLSFFLAFNLQQLWTLLIRQRWSQQKSLPHAKEGGVCQYSVELESLLILSPKTKLTTLCEHKEGAEQAANNFTEWNRTCIGFCKAISPQFCDSWDISQHKENVVGFNQRICSSWQVPKHHAQKQK